MKIVYTLLIIGCVLLGYALTQETAHEVSQLSKANVQTGAEGKEGVSILDAVKLIKTSKVVRSLEGVNAQTDDPSQSRYQFSIWVPIVLAIALFYAIMSILFMEVKK